MDINIIKQYKIIVIIRGYDTDDVLKIVEVLYKSGIKLVEITLNSPNALHSLEKISKIYKNKMFVGAGTVMTVEEVDKAVEHGAQYIISPNLNPEVIKATKKLNKISLPGALTPSEIALARELDADIIKVFPASVFPSSYIKEVSAPLDNVLLLPTGGISIDNVEEYLKNGAVGFGISGNIVQSNQIVTEAFLEEVAKKASLFVDKINGGE